MNNKTHVASVSRCAFALLKCQGATAEGKCPDINKHFMVSRDCSRQHQPHVCFFHNEILQSNQQDPEPKEKQLHKVWSAANGGLRDGGLSESEDIWGKRPFSSVFWISQVLFAPSGKGRKRQKLGEKGRFRPISRKGGQTPLKPPFVTPPFAATSQSNEWGFSGSCSVCPAILTVLAANLLDHARELPPLGSSANPPHPHWYARQRLTM